MGSLDSVKQNGWLVYRQSSWPVDRDDCRRLFIRVLCREPVPPRTKPGPQRRYDDQVRAALITLWEAADRICGKRLKVLIATLTDAMARHAHLALSKQVRQRL
ncbi:MULTISPECIES: hypothetical protein [Burkholderiaceae]|uniref:hypothetical protein n=1 Tax=Burkholderiaceae TaxID=119060 RepID=UPI001F38B271|nr:MULTISPECIES: hypothetical protein [Burkholderiaceae]